MGLLVIVVVLMIAGIGLCEDPVGRATGQSCEMELTSLLPCTTYVQGSTAEPTESCCDNLGDMYRQQPQCLCSFLNTSVFNNTLLPPNNINRTLLLNLPAVCNLLTDDASPCTKLVSFRGEAKNKTTSTRGGGGGEVTTKNNASVAASPMIQVAPNLVPPPPASNFMPSSYSPNLVVLTITTHFLLSTLPPVLICFQL